MAKVKRGALGVSDYIDSIPKKTRQGQGNHTKYAASSRNHAKKRHRGQGRWVYAYQTGLGEKLRPLLEKQWMNGLKNVHIWPKMKGTAGIIVQNLTAKG